jgi:hypothetical protein
LKKNSRGLLSALTTFLLDDNEVRGVWDSTALLCKQLLYRLQALVDIDILLKILGEALVIPWDLLELIWKVRKGFR